MRSSRERSIFSTIPVFSHWSTLSIIFSALYWSLLDCRWWGKHSSGPRRASGTTKLCTYTGYFVFELQEESIQSLTAPFQALELWERMGRYDFYLHQPFKIWKVLGIDFPFALRPRVLELQVIKLLNVCDCTVPETLYVLFHKIFFVRELCYIRIFWGDSQPTFN